MATGTRRHGGTRDDAAGPFTAERTHGVAPRPRNRLIAHSEGLGWRSVSANVTTVVPYEAVMPADPDVRLAYAVRSTGGGWARPLDGPKADGPVSPRRLHVVPPDTPSAWHWEGTGDFARIHIHRALLDRVAEQDFGLDAGRFRLLFRFCVPDPLLEQLALGVMRTMRERPPGHTLYVDCLAQAMAAHLVQHHSTLTRPPKVPKPDGLVDWRLRRLADYIEAELAGDLSLDAMAEQAGLSPHHLARSFRRAFGAPPHRYLVRRRVERAKGLLRATDLPIAEVALACGFATQSHLGEAFRREVGTSPGAYRRGA